MSRHDRHVPQGHAPVRILRRLAASQGRIVSETALIDVLYGDDPNGGPDDPGDCIRTFIKRLRRRLPEGAIENRHGVGYRLHEGVDVSALLPEGRV